MEVYLLIFISLVVTCTYLRPVFIIIFPCQIFILIFICLPDHKNHNKLPPPSGLLLPNYTPPLPPSPDTHTHIAIILEFSFWASTIYVAWKVSMRRRDGYFIGEKSKICSFFLVMTRYILLCLFLFLFEYSFCECFKVGFFWS